MVSHQDVWPRLGELHPHQVKPGLERIRALVDRLGSPQLAYPTAIVAGTNGKGSVATMLSSIGRAANLRVGCYTSPHLSQLEERFRVDGFPVSHDGLTRHLRRVFQAADELLSAGSIDDSPSYFEILTAAAFVYFAEARVDLAVLEVGLGGRWDATNVIRPRVAVITPVSLEHTAWLGTDVKTIAEEKAAVIPSHGVAILAPQQPEARDPILRHAKEKEATVWDAAEHPVEIRALDERRRATFDCFGKIRTYGGLELPLPGVHQVENARCAILAAEALDRRRLRIGSDAVWAGLRRVDWPARCEWIETRPPVLIDAAHNPAAAVVLSEYLDALHRAGTYDRLHLVVGVQEDKDAAGIVGALYPLADTVALTEPPTSRARPAASLAEVADIPGEHVVEADPRRAVRWARRRAGDGDLVCITGSIHLVGWLRPQLLAERED